MSCNERREPECVEDHEQGRELVGHLGHEYECHLPLQTNEGCLVAAREKFELRQEHEHLPPHPLSPPLFPVLSQLLLSESPLQTCEGGRGIDRKGRLESPHVTRSVDELEMSKQRGCREREGYLRAWLRS